MMTRVSVTSFTLVLGIFCSTALAQQQTDNVALNKPASQASTYHVHVAGWAVDGRNDTVSCTNYHVHPWWAVDLQGAYNVSHVTVTNDANLAWRLYNFVVGLTNDNPATTAPVYKSSYTLCGQYSGSVGPAQNADVVCASSSQNYRYVIVQGFWASAEAICLTEVSVYASGRSSTLNSQQIQDVVDRHNQLRAGEGSSDMEVIRWNSQLADLAQEWADACVYDHPDREIHVEYANLGQNLHVNDYISFTEVSSAVQGWFDEKSNHDYDSNTCTGVCGHYTQVVWATSNEVGCGLTFCSSLNANYFVCNYRPAGNYDGAIPFKKGAACSRCNSGVFYCSNNLCNASCSGSEQESTCTCETDCGNCGTATSDCRCECEPGWTGVACREECVNKHEYCAYWPASSCEVDYYVRMLCPALCGFCQAVSEPVCSLTTSQQ